MWPKGVYVTFLGAKRRKCLKGPESFFIIKIYFAVYIQSGLFTPMYLKITGEHLWPQERLPQSQLHLS